MPGGRGRRNGGGSGGPRSGTPGRAYPGRTDLQTPKVAPGQSYGAAGAQLAAQAVVPMGGTPVAPAAVGSPPGTGQPQQGPPGLAPGTPAPGSLGDLLGPSSDPSEHVMNGSASGPGLGPAAFGLNSGANVGVQVQQLVAWLPALEDMANRPGASSATRQMVRTIKSQVSLLPGGNR